MSAQPTSRSHEVYIRMKDAIAAGEWRPDERLPSEEALSRLYGVSRPVLRQALTQLRAEGRILSRKGAGHYVCAVDDRHGFDFGILRNVPDVRHFLEFRRTIESEIAAEVAERASPDALEEVRTRLAALDDSMARGAPSIDEDIAFHLAIARSCQNRFFREALESVTDQMQLATRLNRDLSPSPLPERFQQISAEHHRIFEALESGDPARARGAMGDHLTAGIRRLFGN